MAKKMKRKKKRYAKGDTISLYLNTNISNDLLDWINSQSDVGPDILNILDLFATGQLLPLKAVETLANTLKEKRNFYNDIPVSNTNTLNTFEEDKFTENESNSKPLNQDPIINTENIVDQSVEEVNFDRVDDIRDDTSVTEHKNIIKKDTAKNKKSNPKKLPNLKLNVSTISSKNTKSIFDDK